MDNFKDISCRIVIIHDRIHDPNQCQGVYI